MKDYIARRVHELYYGQDLNCARTTMTCLSELFAVPIEEQTFAAAVGLFGAGGYRAQCGLVEGALMFIGIFFRQLGKGESEAVKACYDYAGEFEAKFGSLRCRELRPGGFREDDPPHLCEKLSCETIEFACNYMMKLSGREYRVLEESK